MEDKKLRALVRNTILEEFDILNEEEYHDPTPQPAGVPPPQNHPAPGKPPAPKKPEPTVKTDLTNDALTDYLGTMDGLESAFGDMVNSVIRLESAYGITNPGGDGYPFDAGIGEMYKKVIRWTALAKESIQRRIETP